MAIHTQSHAMTSVDNHSSGNWKLFYSNGSAAVVELALPAINAPLLSGGAAAAPVFGTLFFAPAPITCAGPAPVDSEVTWENDTLGICIGSGGDIYLTYKNASDVYYGQLTAI